MKRDDFIAWFTGGEEYNYHSLAMCMDGDTLWVNLCIASGITVFLSYLLIMVYFSARYLSMRKTRYSNAMMFGALVFLFCGVTGYLMSGLLSYYWPARRLETLMRLATAVVNAAWAYHLYRIKFLEKILAIDVKSVVNPILNIDAKIPHNGSDINADAG